MSVVVEPSDADFEAACSRRFMDGKVAWAALKNEARKVAAERLLAANSAERKRLNDGLSGLSHERYIEQLERFDRLAAESEELQRIAYPAAFSGSTDG